jgi:hypothetical protein
MPEVLISPLIVLSALIVILPVPIAEVVTGGVSSAPVSSTLTSPPKADAVLKTSAADARAMWRRRKFPAVVKEFINSSPW